MSAKRIFQRLGQVSFLGGVPSTETTTTPTERAEDHYFAAVRLAENGAYEEAKSEFRRALREAPDFIDAYYGLGDACIETQQFREAIKTFKQAIALQPDSIKAYNGLGLAHDRAGHFVEAIQVYIRAIPLAPQDIETRINLGAAYFNIGSYSEAIKAYQQALNIDSNNARAYFCLGLVYVDLKDQLLVAEQANKLRQLGQEQMANDLEDSLQRRLWL
jgi:Flp pilus assembly protein TadD